MSFIFRVLFVFALRSYDCLLLFVCLLFVRVFACVRCDVVFVLVLFIRVFNVCFFSGFLVVVVFFVCVCVLFVFVCWCVCAWLWYVCSFFFNRCVFLGAAFLGVLLLLCFPSLRLIVVWFAVVVIKCRCACYTLCFVV